MKKRRLNCGRDWISEMGKRRISNFTFLLAALALVWLPFEDTGPLIPVLIGLAGSALFAAHNLNAHPRQTDNRKHLGLGLVLGFGPVLIPIFLMVFKSGLHNHGFPDFPLSDTTRILTFFPFSLVFGLIFSISFSRFRKMANSDHR